MPHDIIDNLQIKLVDELKKKLRVAKTAKFAIGWFFLTGLKEIKEEIEKLDKIYILAGAKTNKETAETLLMSKRYEEAVEHEFKKLKSSNKIKINEILESEFKNLITHISSIKPTAENIEFIKWFWDKLRKKKIEIRIYPKETLHAKLYLLEYKDKNHGLGMGFIGSSNLSIKGFNLNTELNVAVYGDSNYQILNNWFDNLWNQSKDAEFTEIAASAIKKSWVMNDEVTPFRAYLRILHEIFSYTQWGEVPETDYGGVHLYHYQLDAVRDAYRRLQKYNGVFLADVPGLGKTYMGAALLCHLQEEGKRAIVICPPKLKEQWEEVLSEFGVGTAKVFSHSKLDSIIEDNKIMKREVVLIDESHHFRNPETNRYKDIELICEGKQVILVGATPQNLSIWDLYYQIKLFTPSEVNHKFRIYPAVLKEYFKACEEGKANIEDLINEVVIRRTRSDIIEYYNQEEIPAFPKRIGPKRIDYSIDKVYPGGIFKKLNELIEKMTFARYDLGSYIKEEQFTPDEKQRLKQAGKNLRKIMKMILFRRLESSIAALKDSAEWMYKAHEVFLKALDQQKVLAGEASEDVIDQLKAGTEIEDIEIPETSYPANKFYVNDLKKNIEKDRDILIQIHNLVANLSPSQDEKLQKLIYFLKNEISNKKTIIFTEFASTAKYLGEELKKHFEKVDYVFQGEGEVIKKAKRFAPKSNKLRLKSDQEIDILISTEILSEGLNLQDGQVVVNYELHWNPVRIIQRIGRIDRIGSEHDKIWVYNFFPQEETDKEIGIKEKVLKRIDEIITLYGADEKTIAENEKTIRKKLFQIYTEDERSMEEEEIKSKSSYFRHQWLKLRKQYEEEYKKSLNLPEMVTCAMTSKTKGIAIFLRADDYFKLILSSPRGEIITTDDWDVLSLIEANIFKQNEKIYEEHFSVLEKVKIYFEHELNKREHEKNMYLDKIKTQTIQIIEKLKKGKPQKFKELANETIIKVREVKLTSEAKSKLRKLRRMYGLLPNDFIEKVLAIVNNLGKEELPKPERKYAQIVISESLI
jgi:ERCC4-related helicase